MEWLLRCGLHVSCFLCLFFLLLGVGWLTPLLEDDEGRKAGWNRKEMEKERYDIILRSGLLWNQGVYSGQRFPVMGTGEEGKKWRGKVKKDSYKEIPASGFDAATSGSQKS